MRVLKVLVFGAVVVAGFGAAGWYGLRQIPVSFGYSIRGDFEALPENDTPLEEWLRSQPGVLGYPLLIERHNRSVGVTWMMTQTAGSREPPAPDLRRAFEQFGYRGLIRLDYDWHGSDDWPE